MPFYLGRKAIRKVPGTVIKAAPIPVPELIQGFGTRERVGAFCAEAGFDGGQRLYLFQALCGKADNVAARGGQGAALGHAGFYVKGVGVAHRLHGNGMAVAYDYAAYVAGNVFHQNL